MISQESNVQKAREVVTMMVVIYGFLSAVLGVDAAGDGGWIEVVEGVGSIEGSLPLASCLYLASISSRSSSRICKK